MPLTRIASIMCLGVSANDPQHICDQVVKSYSLVRHQNPSNRLLTHDLKPVSASSFFPLTCRCSSRLLCRTASPRARETRAAGRRGAATMFGADGGTWDLLLICLLLGSRRYWTGFASARSSGHGTVIRISKDLCGSHAVDITKYILLMLHRLLKKTADHPPHVDSSRKRS